MAFRCALVGLAGRPNVGKSTLVNAIVGEHVSITSSRAQTTRRRIAGIAHGDGWQLVLADLPGIQVPRDGLTRRMADSVQETLSDVDLVLLVLDASQPIGGGDRASGHQHREHGAAPRPLHQPVRGGHQKEQGQLLAVQEARPAVEREGGRELGRFDDTGKSAVAFQERRDRQTLFREPPGKPLARQNASELFDQIGGGIKFDALINGRLDERAWRVGPQKSRHHNVGVEHNLHEVGPRWARRSAR